MSHRNPLRWFRFNPDTNADDQRIYRKVGRIIGDDMKKRSLRIEEVVREVVSRGFNEEDIESVLDQFQEHSCIGTFDWKGHQPQLVPSDIIRRWQLTWSVRIILPNGRVHYEFVMP